MQQLIIIAFLFCVGACRGQEHGVVADEKEIINLELARRKDSFSNVPVTNTIIGDSILVDKLILKPEKCPVALMNWLIASKNITTEEGSDIFGKNSQDNFIPIGTTHSEWTKADLRLQGVFI
ncbi:hypothetical protein FMM05_14225 [Flavobacterium zepuense]|uniref:Uncharacterized protein n=1 Tax=Flavobacterium zepuense TaxID=2593302 RepID=A0A552UYN0_9FLAO|nr:hypothetical protein [Flavobacterium zepuense]TRW23346.1 hypothetical protein FMM05_14225 [Flavobacterium zepuense]